MKFGRVQHLIGFAFMTLITNVKIINCEAIKTVPNDDVKEQRKTPLEVEEIFKKVMNGLEDIYRRTNDVTGSLQENVVDIVNEGREKLYVLKKDILKKIETNEISSLCKNQLQLELKGFEDEIKIDLNSCKSEVFQSSQLYRRTVKDEIGDIESGIDDLRKMIRNCFAAEFVDPNLCYYDQANEYNRIADELISGFDEIYKICHESAIEVLSEIMECQKFTLKKARRKQNELKSKITVCGETNNL